MVKIKLLNDSGFVGMENVNFPVEVAGEILENKLARITREELIIVGAKSSAFPKDCYHFDAGDYQLIEPTYNKPLIDAVAKFGVEFPTSDETDDNLDQIIQAKREFDGYEKGDLTSGSSVRDNEYWKVICTIEEFNQCVKEMSEFVGAGSYKQYCCFKQPLTKENSDYSFYGGKPVVKVEYVEVNPNEDGGAFWECARDFACGLVGVFHWKDFYGEFKMIQDNEQLIKYYKLRNVYRKVETEISPKELLIEQVAHNVREHCYPNYQKDNPNPCATYFEETLKVLSELGHLK